MSNLAVGSGTAGGPAGSGLGFGASVAASSLSLLEPKDIACKSRRPNATILESLTEGADWGAERTEGFGSKMAAEHCWLRHYQPISPKIQHRTLQAQSPEALKRWPANKCCKIVPSKNLYSKCNTLRFLSAHSREKTKGRQTRKGNPERMYAKAFFTIAHTTASKTEARLSHPGSSHGLQASGFHKTLQVQPSIEAKPSSHSSNLCPPTHPQLGVRYSERVFPAH